jgi:hypothetical protein
MRGLFGDAVIDQTTTVWGVDEEGEINGCYRPSGYPGVSINLRILLEVGAKTTLI